VSQHTWGQFHQHVDEQFLPAKIPKAQKDSQVTSVFLRFWDLRIKDACKKLVKSTPVYRGIFRGVLPNLEIS